MTEKLSDFTQQTPTLAKFVAGANVGSPNQKYSLSDIQTLFNTTAPAIGTLTGQIYVNSFYPTGISPGNVTGSSGGGTNTRPLSNFYTTLAAAQAAFPDLNFATYGVTLADEVDWCVWQSCMDFIFNKPDFAPGVKLPAATVIAYGQYGVNRTILCRATSLVIMGATGPFTSADALENNSSWISWNGPIGTVDTNNAIITFDLSATTTQTGQIHVQYLGFQSLDPTTHQVKPGLFTALSQATYVNAIQIGALGTNLTNIVPESCEVDNCVFATGLWDGVKMLAASIELNIHHNQYQGVQRDGNSICAVAANFSTTVWINNNEYGVVGRYGTIINSEGSFFPSHVLRDEDYEGAYSTSFFLQNPEWFVQGLPAQICIINGAGVLIDQVRAEAGADFQTNLWTDIHILATNSPKFIGGSYENICFATWANANRKTAAATAFEAANKFLDITNQRNYNACNLGDFDSSSACGNITIISPALAAVPRVYLLGGVGVSATSFCNFIGATASFWTIPTQAGTFATVAQPQSNLTTPPTLMFGALNAQIAMNGCFNCLNPRGSFNFIEGQNHQGVFSGLLESNEGAAVLPAWQANHNYSMAPSFAYNPLVIPTVENGFFFQATTTGVSAAVEPIWPTTVGNTVVDNGVTWLCVGTIDTNASLGGFSRLENWLKGNRHFAQAAIPLSGDFIAGDTVQFTSPTSGGFIGAVCITPGNPGVWKTYGLIS